VHVQCAGARALRPPVKSFFQEGSKTPNPDLEARASSEHRCIALHGVLLRDDLSRRRKTAVRTSTITMRLGWLARAAFVFSGGRTGGRRKQPVRECPCHLDASGPSAERLAPRSEGSFHPRIPRAFVFLQPEPYAAVFHTFPTVIPPPSIPCNRFKPHNQRGSLRGSLRE